MRLKSKLFTILIILVVLLSQHAVIRADDGKAWLTGWRYRKRHVINPSNNAGTHYQIKIVTYYGSGVDYNNNTASPPIGYVYLNAHCRGDFGDVRFTGSDGQTLLKYWMERFFVNDNATFWVRVLDDLSSSPVQIYIYYGKSDATSASNPEETFQAYLSCEGYPDNTVQPGNWTEFHNWGTGRGPYFAGVVSTRKYSGEKSYKMSIRSRNSDYRDGVMNLWRITSHKHLMVSGWIYVEHVSSSYYGSTAGFIVAFNVCGTWKAIYYRYAFATRDIRALYFIGTTRVTPTIQVNVTNTVGSWRHFNRNLYADFTTYNLGNWDLVTEVRLFLAIRAHDGPSTGDTGNATAFYDDVIARKYVSPEPTHDEWGCEEEFTYTRSAQQTLYLCPVALRRQLTFRNSSQPINLIVDAARRSTYVKTFEIQLLMLLSTARAATYFRTVKMLVQLRPLHFLKFTIYVEAPKPTPVPAPVVPSIQLDTIIQTARITRVWWKPTAVIEVLVVNKGTVASDVTFEYEVLDRDNQVVAQGKQTVFISGLDKKTVYVNIRTPKDGTYTVHFRTISPVKVEAKTATLTVETPFYGSPIFAVMIVLMIVLLVLWRRKR